MFLFLRFLSLLPLTIVKGQDIITGQVKDFVKCLSNKPSIDPVLGELKLERETYCSKGAGKAIPGFIDGITCCHPMSTEEMKLKLYLYMPGSKGNKQDIKFNDKQLGKKLKSFPKVVYIFHGFVEIPLIAPWITLTREYWNSKNIPVIVVDYSYGNQLQYFQQMANIRTVGKAVGYSIINWDIIDKTLIIGLSLGGQALGHVGLYVKQKSGGRKVAECHALDPAGPFYIGGPKDAKLDKSDCKVVQVIHMTSQLNQELTIVEVAASLLGTDEKSGHCDYWVNCGYAQVVTCAKGAASSVTNLKPVNLPFNLVICGHTRSAVIYVNELYGKCNFTSDTCADCGNKNLICKSSEENVNQLPPFSKCSTNLDQNFVLFTNKGDDQCKSYTQGSYIKPFGE